MSTSLGVINQVAASKNNFLSRKGKVLLTISSITSLLARLAAILLFFAPSLGLMNLLMHWIMGKKTIKVEKIFVVIDGNPITFDEVWVPTPDYTDYTVFSLKTYYITFLVFKVIHFALVFILKWIVADGFKATKSLTEKIHHILIQLFVPSIFKDWDENELTSKSFIGLTNVAKFSPPFWSLIRRNILRHLLAVAIQP